MCSAWTTWPTCRPRSARRRSTPTPSQGTGAWLIDAGRTSARTDATGIEAAVEAEIDDAVEFALASPTPTSSELYTDVYGEGVR